mmetsp:Transcript_18012/g.55138  ORF Transcript_18012/g.55138 Transcript_18012/m.55138 type:complete len:483 (-) Transcript_18012:169-1617(-)
MVPVVDPNEELMHMILAARQKQAFQFRREDFILPSMAVQLPPQAAADGTNTAATPIISDPEPDPAPFRLVLRRELEPYRCCCPAAMRRNARTAATLPRATAPCVRRRFRQRLGDELGPLWEYDTARELSLSSGEDNVLAAYCCCAASDAAPFESLFAVCRVAGERDALRAMLARPTLVDEACVFAFYTHALLMWLIKEETESMALMHTSVEDNLVGGADVSTRPISGSIDRRLSGLRVLYDEMRNSSEMRKVATTASGVLYRAGSDRPTVSRKGFEDALLPRAVQLLRKDGILLLEDVQKDIYIFASARCVLRPLLLREWIYQGILEDEDASEAEEAEDNAGPTSKRPRPDPSSTSDEDGNASEDDENLRANINSGANAAARVDDLSNISDKMQPDRARKARAASRRRRMRIALRTEDADAPKSSTLEDPGAWIMSLQETEIAVHNLQQRHHCLKEVPFPRWERAAADVRIILRRGTEGMDR